MSLFKKPAVAEIGANPPILIDHVTKSFGEKTAVSDITLEIPGGQVTTIIGPSGSGKSTLLRTINLLERPDSGQVIIGGHDVTAPGAPFQSIRQQIGMVFQHYSLFPHLSVADNVAFGLRQAQGKSQEEARAVALEELERVGISHLADRRPEYISGGERQRAAIARSLAVRPRIVLFDEITSALDPELVHGVLTLVNEFRALGTTTVVVTHEMRFARESSDTVVFMDNGKLIEQGTSSQIFDSPSSDRLRDFVRASH